MGANEMKKGFIDGPVKVLRKELVKTEPIGLNEYKLSDQSWLGERQVINAEKTIPHLKEQLVKSGALANLQNYGTSKFEFKGLWFADHDIHKSLEGFFWNQNYQESEAFSDFIQVCTDALKNAQEPDGYLNTWFGGVHPEKKFSDFASGHEMYNAGHLIQAAVAQNRTSENAPVMVIARKLADLLVKSFGTPETLQMCGHPEIETALIELYRETGEKSYLNLAELMIRGRGFRKIKDTTRHPFNTDSAYLQDHTPATTATTATGHAVRQIYLNTAVVDLYMENAEKALLEAQEKMWEDTVYTKMFVTGGLGVHHRAEDFGDSYELPNDRGYQETCVAIANVMWSWRLLLITGKRRYADVIELSLFNTIAGSLSTDGCNFFYSNPLHLRRDHIEFSDNASPQRIPWYACPCCPPNITRLIASVNHYLVSKKANELSLHTYADGKLSTTLENGLQVDLDIKTKYPFDEKVTINNATKGQYVLKLRIPDWCSSFDIKLNSKPLDKQVVVEGYLHLDREWSAGDSVELTLSMAAEFIAPNPRIDASRGCVAIRLGPIVYAIEQEDVQDSKLNIEDFVVDASKKPVINNMDFPIHGATKALTISGGYLQAPNPQSPAYFAHGEKINIQTASAIAIPYFLWGNRGFGGMRVWVPES